MMKSHGSESTKKISIKYGILDDDTSTSFRDTQYIWMFMKEDLEEFKIENGLIHTPMGTATFLEGFVLLMDYRGYMTTMHSIEANIKYKDRLIRHEPRDQLLKDHELFEKKLKVVRELIPKEYDIYLTGSSSLLLNGVNLYYRKINDIDIVVDIPEKNSWKEIIGDITNNNIGIEYDEGCDMAIAVYVEVESINHKTDIALVDDENRDLMKYYKRRIISGIEVMVSPIWQCILYKYKYMSNAKKMTYGSGKKHYEDLLMLFNLEFETKNFAN